MRMFKNPGQKLKSYAAVIFVIIVIISIIFAFAVSAYKDYSYYGVKYPELAKTKFHPIPLFAILIGGIGGGYLSCLMLSGFGELIENSGIIAGKQEKTINDDPNASPMPDAIVVENNEDDSVIVSDDNEYNTTLAP